MADMVKLPPFVVNETPLRGSVSDDSLKGFYQAAQRLGFAKDNLFRVTNITNIKELQTGERTINRFFTPSKLLYVKTGNIPSRRISTAKLNYKNFSFNVPIAASYPNSLNWTLTFYSDDTYLIKDIFEYWSQQVYNEHGFKSNQTAHTDITLTLYKPVQLGVGKLEKINKEIVDKRSKQDRLDIFNMQPVRDYKLYGCFPVNLGDIAYNTTTTGNIASISTTFAFQYIGSNETTALVKNTLRSAVPVNNQINPNLAGAA